MKSSLAILVVIAMVAAVSGAAVYNPTMDTYLRYDAGVASTPQATAGYTGTQTETYGGQNGTSSACRAGKAYQDQFIMAYDRATILADASVALGHTATAADFISGAATMTLSLMASGNGFNHAAVYTPAYLTSTTAWTRENHSAYDFADGDEDAGLAGEYVLWNGGVNDSALGDTPRNGGAPSYTIQDSPRYLAAAGIVWAAADFMYQDFAYPGTLAAGFLFNSNNAYLEMYGDFANNGSCFSKEGKWIDGTTYAGPKLTIMVPEPMTLSLLAAGALALIRRRK